MTRASIKWDFQHLPGYFDTTNTSWLFNSTNYYGIPDLCYNHHIEPSTEMFGWGSRRMRNPRTRAETMLHFYLDDYKFESVWSRPLQILEGLQHYRAVLTPDFSLYRDHPLIVQIYNTYRNRWLGAFWQAHGLDVIPSLNWSNEESYSFCFLGVPKYSQVSITHGDCRNPTNFKYFKSGVEEMLRQVEPGTVLFYGNPMSQIESLIAAHARIIRYVPQYVELREEIKRDRAVKAKQNNNPILISEQYQLRIASDSFSTSQEGEDKPGQQLSFDEVETKETLAVNDEADNFESY